MEIETHFVGKYAIEGVENYATISDCYEYIKDKKVLGLDIETTRKFPKRKETKREVYRGGLDPYLSEVVMLQIGDLNNLFVIDVRDYTLEELKPITDFLHWNKHTLFVGVNLKFEGKHLRHNYGIRLNKVWDCMIAEMCLYNGLKRSFSLAGLAKEYLSVMEVGDINLFESSVEVTLNDEALFENEFLITPFEVAENDIIDKSTRMGFVTIGKKKFTARQVLYGADDILYPLLIMERQLLGRNLPNGEIYLPMKLFRMENSMTQVVADMELNGVPFDADKWIAIAEKHEAIYKERIGKLNKYIIDLYPKFTTPPNLFDFEDRCDIEWSSPAQVVKLFRYLDICPQEFSKQTKRKEYTVGATALQKTMKNEYKDNYQYQVWVDFDTDENGKYIEDHQKLILNFLLMKKTEQLITGFGKDWLRFVHPITGRIHSNYRQILNSGRMGCSSPNMQNQPNGEHRDPFCVPEDSDRILIFTDFSNQEVRTVACLAEEDVMIEFFIKGHPVYGDDMHTYTANNMHKAKNPDAEDYPHKDSELFTKEHKKKRGEAKIISFGLLYGKEAKGFGEDFGLSEEEAQTFVDAYFEAYPKLKEAMDKWAKHTFKNQYIQIDETTDRRWFSEMFDEMNEAQRDAKAYFPDEYFKKDVMSKEEKAEIKEDINARFPEVKKHWRNFFGIKGALSRKSTNFRVQGTSASETKTAMIMMRNEEIDRKLDVKIIITVHDEIGLEGPEKDVEKLTNFAVRNMQDGANFFLNPPIMKAEPAVGKKWIH